MLDSGCEGKVSFGLLCSGSAGLSSRAAIPYVQKNSRDTEAKRSFIGYLFGQRVDRFVNSLERFLASENRQLRALKSRNIEFVN